MLTILVINPPSRENVIANVPLGLLYITQPLIEQGHQIIFYDIALENPSREQVLEKIKSETFDVMLVGGIVTTYGYLKWLTKEVKKMHPYIPIMIGGGVATPIPHIIFENMDVDVVCIGEGDATVPEYISALENNTDILDVAGIFAKDGDSCIKTPDRPLVTNLDSINPPFDAFKLLDMEKMYNPHLKNMDTGNNLMVTVDILALYQGVDVLENVHFVTD